MMPFKKTVDQKPVDLAQRLGTYLNSVALRNLDT